MEAVIEIDKYGEHDVDTGSYVERNSCCPQKNPVSVNLMHP